MPLMTLREFTKTHLKDNTKSELEVPVWKLAFPPKIRQHRKVIGKTFWGMDHYETVLEEAWIRVHKGDIIDTEWRDVPYFDDEPWL